MPSVAEATPRLCIFGDSHIACLRTAVDQRPPAGVEIDFWGTAGTRFRMIGLEEGVIRPADAQTARRFAAVSREGARMALDPAEFDAILFMGVRCRVQRLFAEFLHRARDPALFLSGGVKRAVIRAHLHEKWVYRIARDIAGRGCARILFAPVSFPTAGISTENLDRFPQAGEGSNAERDEIWALIREVMAADGIDLVPQPGRTVTGGCFTAPAYASDRAIARGDSTHRNAAYGRLVLSAALRLLAAPPPARVEMQTSGPAPAMNPRKTA